MVAYPICVTKLGKKQTRNSGCQDHCRIVCGTKELWLSNFKPTSNYKSIIRFATSLIPDTLVGASGKFKFSSTYFSSITWSMTLFAVEVINLLILNLGLNELKELGGNGFEKKEIQQKWRPPTRKRMQWKIKWDWQKKTSSNMKKWSREICLNLWAGVLYRWERLTFLRCLFAAREPNLARLFRYKLCIWHSMLLLGGACQS